MGSLEDSKSICRLCGQEKEEMISLLYDTELRNDLMTFLPIEVCFLTMAVSNFENKSGKV